MYSILASPRLKSNLIQHCDFTDGQIEVCKGLGWGETGATEREVYPTPAVSLPK